MGCAVWALWKSAVVSVSAALETTCQIVLHSVRSGPLEVIIFVLEGSGPKKKWLTRRLQARGNTRYTTPESIWSTMLLA